MSRRGGILISIALALSMLCLLIGCIGAITDRFDIAAFVMALSCFLVLIAVYLEVYSHRE